MSFNPPTYKDSDYVKWEGDWELIEGYPFAMSSSPLGKHQYIMRKLARVFDEALEECECEGYPELDWVIDKKTVVRPDFEKVKIYRLDNKKYDKIYEGEGKFAFDLCEIEVDFGKIFKKRRK